MARGSLATATSGGWRRPLRVRVRLEPGGHPLWVTTTEDARAAAQDIRRSYDAGGEVDLPGYTGSLATYATTLGLLLAACAATHRRLPERFETADLVVGGVAVHKLARLVSRSSVASPLRAPFTEFEAAAGSGEHVERARGEHGVRHTVGELLTCPFCLGVWVSTAYVAGLALAPRPTRALAAVFSVTAVSDSLQHAYARLRGD